MPRRVPASNAMRCLLLTCSSAMTRFDPFGCISSCSGSKRNDFRFLFLTATSQPARYLFRSHFFVPQSFQTQSYFTLCLIFLCLMEPLSRPGTNQNPHRKWLGSVSKSSRRTEEVPETHLAKLRPSKESPPCSLLQRMSSPNPKSTTLWDCISRSSSSATNPLTSETETPTMEDQRSETNRPLAPSVQDHPTELQGL